MCASPDWGQAAERLWGEMPRDRGWSSRSSSASVRRVAPQLAGDQLAMRAGRGRRRRLARPRERSTKARNWSPSRTTTAASAARSWATISRKLRVWGRTRRRRRRRPARSCSARRAGAGCRRQRQCGPRPTRPPARPRCRPAGRGRRGERLRPTGGCAVARRGPRRPAARPLPRSARDGAARRSGAARKAIAQVGVSLQSQGLFGLLRAAGEEDNVVRADAGGVAQRCRGGIGAIGLRAVEFYRAGDVDRRGATPRARKRAANSSFCAATTSIFESSAAASRPSRR